MIQLKQYGMNELRNFSVLTSNGLNVVFAVEANDRKQLRTHIGRIGLIPRTLGPSNDYTLLNGWILFAWCVRLSRLLVGFRMDFKSLHFHFISFKSYAIKPFIV